MLTTISKVFNVFRKLMVSTVVIRWLVAAVLLSFELTKIAGLGSSQSEGK